MYSYQNIAKKQLYGRLREDVRSIIKSLCAYKNVDYLNDVIYSALSKRQEYHRIGHLHIFENQLTHEIIHLEVKKYAIEVESRDKNNIFFDILYHNLKSYVIIDENL